MKRLLSILITLSILFALTVGGSPSSAQNAAADGAGHFATPRAKQKDYSDKIHASLRGGASPEARAAWEKATPEQREQVKATIEKAIGEAKAKHEREKQEKRDQKAEVKNWKDILKGKPGESLPDSPLYFTDKQGGNAKVVRAKEREQVISAQRCYDCEPIEEPCPECYPEPTPTPYGTPTPTPTPNSTPTPTPVPSGDADADGLPESFENAVADAFTPIYHVSANEPDNFATFANSNTQIVEQVLGKTPFSYFRVQPLGFAYNYWGQLVSVLRIDYLTLWNHDSGLMTGSYCSAFPPLNSLAGAVAHDFDNERSAALVAAPVGSYTYNLNPSAYSIYSYYTAAHEGEPNDKSRYADFPTNPVPAGNHIHLALSMSKHGTYTYNPDYISLVPDYIIEGIIAAVDYWCYRAMFDYNFGGNDIGCLLAMYYAYGAIYECAVERFIDQGGQFAQGRVNVGEPSNPINGANFIRDNTHGLNSKLVNPTF